MDIIKRYGHSITLKGIDGAEKIEQMLTKIRNNPPTKIGKYKVEEFRDYKAGITKNLVTKEDGKTTLPKSNVLYFELEGNRWCCARPSGTEPKIKFYIGVKEETMEEADKELEILKNDLLKIIE